MTTLTNQPILDLKLISQIWTHYHHLILLPSTPLLCVMMDRLPFITGRKRWLRNRMLTSPEDGLSTLKLEVSAKTRNLAIKDGIQRSTSCRPWITLKRKALEVFFQIVQKTALCGMPTRLTFHIAPPTSILETLVVPLKLKNCGVISSVELLKYKPCSSISLITRDLERTKETPLYLAATQLVVSVVWSILIRLLKFFSQWVLMSLVFTILHSTWTLNLCTQIQFHHLMWQTICSLKILRLRDRISFLRTALMISQRIRSSDACSDNTVSTTWKLHSLSLLINLMHSKFQEIQEVKKPTTPLLPQIKKYLTTILELSLRNTLRHWDSQTSHSQEVFIQPLAALMLSLIPTCSSQWRLLETSYTSQCHRKTC